MPGTGAKASLVIPTYNREELLVDSLRDALDSDYPNLEIIVVDQTPRHKPETEAFLKSVEGRVVWIRARETGLPKARNAGLRKATGDYIIFTDDDVRFERDFVSRHVRELEDGADVVQGRIIEGAGNPSESPQWMSFWIRVSGSNDCPRRGDINTLTGCNFSLKRSVYEKIGGFDERLLNPSLLEDGDWAIRAHKAGFRLRYSPLPALRHLRSGRGGVDTGVENQFLSKNYYLCCFLYAYKNHHPLAVLNYAVRLHLRGLKALFRTIRAARREARDLLARG